MYYVYLTTPQAMNVVLKAIHARGGLLPASIHVFEAGWRE